MNKFLTQKYWEKAKLRDVERDIEYGYDVNAQGGLLAVTPLMRASMHNENPKIIELLIDEGADVNESNDVGWTPLMYASALNNNPKIITTLIDNGADVNARDDTGYTTLMAASLRNKNPKIMTTLIDEGVDVDVQDSSGRTAWDYFQRNKKLSKNKKLARLLQPTRRDSYRGFSDRTRLDRTRRISRRYR